MKNDKKQTIEWAILHYDKWQLYVARTEKGLCYVGSPGQTYEELKSLMQSKRTTRIFRRNQADFLPSCRYKRHALSTRNLGSAESNTLWTNLFLFRYCPNHPKTCSCSGGWYGHWRKPNSDHGTMSPGYRKKRGHYRLPWRYGDETIST
jgi:hypothetical protein